MAVTNREQFIAILARLTTVADKPTVINTLMEFLHAQGYDDVAEALVTALNATGTVVSSTLNQSLITQARNRNYNIRSHHDRL